MRRERWLVVGGQAVGQLATVATLPLLTRVLEPAPMGLYQSAFALGLILQPLASLRLEFLLPAVQGSEELRRLVRLSIWSQIICGAGLLSIYLILTLLGQLDAGQVAAMAGLVMAAYAWTVVDNSLLVRRGELRRLAARNLLAGLLTAGTQIVVALVVPNVFLLALAIFFGRAAAILVTRRARPAAEVAASDNEVVARWTFTRGAYAVLSGLVSAASLQALTVYAAAGYGVAAAGGVGVAQRSASAPVGFLSQGLSQYSQAQIAAELRAGNGATKEVWHQVRGTIPLAIAATLALGVLGPLLSPFVFGPGWPDVGPIIAILAIPIGFQLLLSPIMSVFVMLGREKLLLAVQVSRLGASLLGALAGQLLTGVVLGSVLGFAVGTCAGYAIMMIALWRVVRVR